jgi:hypothetical protein
LGGGDVVAVVGYHEFLLAIDDAQSSGVVERADVAGANPAVGGEGRSGFLRLVVVGRRCVVAAGEDLAV